MLSCVRGGGDTGTRLGVQGGDRGGVPLGFFRKCGVSGDISPVEKDVLA